MGAAVPRITGISIVCLAVCSGTHERKYQSSVSLAFVRGIHRSSVDSPHKGPITQKCLPLMTSFCGFNSHLVDEMLYSDVAWVWWCGISNNQQLDSLHGLRLTAKNKKSRLRITLCGEATYVAGWFTCGSSSQIIRKAFLCHDGISRRHHPFKITQNY